MHFASLNMYIQLSDTHLKLAMYMVKLSGDICMNYIHPVYMMLVQESSLQKIHVHV